MSLAGSGQSSGGGSGGVSDIQINAPRSNSDAWAGTDPLERYESGGLSFAQRRRAMMPQPNMPMTTQRRDESDFEL